MEWTDKYEAVIGLEVHAQLLTNTKIFASDNTTYGEPPNTQVSAITLALPGVLPKLNEQVYRKAVTMGLACHCKINRHNCFARKNYFYPDLPKGYQISQDKEPICMGGYVEIDTESEGSRKVALTRIHMEEDAGKNNHELDPLYSLVDLNRAGTPLIEIVSEPDMSGSLEAAAFLTEVRKLVRYLDICDGNMEEGSLRCDANISIRLKGDKQLGTKVEVKNMNSIRNVRRAIDGEIVRQVDLMEAGKPILQQTRSYNPDDGSTFPLRSKEYAHDYRYFPEPDLPPLVITEEELDEVRQTMPPLPKELYIEFREKFGLNEYDSKVLTDDRDIALFFRDLAGKTTNVKQAANWIMGTIKSHLNDRGTSILSLSVTTEQIATLIALVDESKLSLVAAKKVFEAMVDSPGAEPLAVAERLNLVQDSNTDQLEFWADAALAKFPDKVAAYKKGKKGLWGLFMGEVMKQSLGKADPRVATEILKRKLD